MMPHPEKDLRSQIEAMISCRLPQSAPSYPELLEAMRYAVLGGGKRIRGRLFLLAGRSLTLPEAELEDYIAALEMIHAYSLVHDDLPAMDNDDLRRGKPSLHKAFGEATAILTGDALLHQAMEILFQAAEKSLAAARTSTYLAHCAGFYGMVGGQAMDLSLVGVDQSAVRQPFFREMQLRKTAALFRASLVGPLILAGREELRARGEALADATGEAYQLVDDLLDEDRSAVDLGKSQGKDRRDHKLTSLSYLGLAGAHERLDKLRESTAEMLEQLAEKGYGSEELSALLESLWSRRR